MTTKSHFQAQFEVFFGKYSTQAYEATFGLSLIETTYLWTNYCPRAGLDSPLHLLMILHFLKCYDISYRAALCFGVSHTTYLVKVEDGLLRLARVLDLVRS